MKSEELICAQAAVGVNRQYSRGLAKSVYEILWHGKISNARGKTSHYNDLEHTDCLQCADIT